MGIIPCDIVLFEIIFETGFLSVLSLASKPQRSVYLSQTPSMGVTSAQQYIFIYLLFVGGVASVYVKVRVYVWLFYEGPGIKLISSCLHSKLFTDWHIFPAQPSVFPSCEASFQTLTTVEYGHIYTVFPPSVLASNLYRTEVPVW